MSKEGELSKRLWALAYPDGTIEGNDSSKINDVLAEAKKEFPSLYAWEKSTFDYNTVRNYVFPEVSQRERIMIEWFKKWFGEVP